MAPFSCPTPLPTHQANMTAQSTQPTTNTTSREILLQKHQPIPTIISSPSSQLMPPPSHPSGLRIRIKNQTKISISSADPSPSSPTSQSEAIDPFPLTQGSIRKTRSKASQEDAELLTLLDELKSHESKNLCKTDAIYASNCLSHTKKYEWLIAEVVDDFLDALASVEDGKWSNMLKLVPHEGLTDKNTHLKFSFLLVG